jgi:competence protein ComEC
MSQRWRTALLLSAILVFGGCLGVSTGSDERSTASTADQATAGTSESPAPAGTMEIHFINVGQSTSTLVVGPTGETMLIDTGDFRTDGKYVLQYLQANGVERIDHLVVTHNDADHIGGNAAIIEYMETQADGVGAVYDPGVAANTKTYERYLDAVERYDVTLYRRYKATAPGLDPGVEADNSNPQTRPKNMF